MAVVSGRSVEMFYMVSGVCPDPLQKKRGANRPIREHEKKKYVMRLE